MLRVKLVPGKECKGCRFEYEHCDILCNMIGGECLPKNRHGLGENAIWVECDESEPNRKEITFDEKGEPIITEFKNSLNVNKELKKRARKEKTNSHESSNNWFDNFLIWPWEM